MKEKECITRSKLMGAATEVFSEKGFDGSRVDEIAARAGVNKAMLYYYFESKSKLLEEIVKKYVDESIKLKKSILKYMDAYDQNQVDIAISKMYDFLESKQDILRIIIIESLKAQDKELPIFNSLMASFEIKIKNLKDRGITLSKEDEMGLLIESFFFNTVSWVFFLALGNKWAGFYGFDKAEAKKKFKEIFMKHRCIFYGEFINK